MAKRGIMTTITCLTLLLPALALAGPDKAEELYKEAQKKYQESEFEEAAELLDQAHKEDPKLIYQYNRIRSLEGAGKYKEALDVLEEYEKPMLESGNFEEVPDLKRELERRIKESDASKKQKKNDEKNETKPPPSASSNVNTYVGWSLLGASGLLFGTAGYLGSYLPFNQSVTDRLKNGGTFNRQEIRTLKTHKTLSIGALALGTATLIGGSVLLLTHNPRSDTPKTTKLFVGPKNIGVRIRF